MGASRDLGLLAPRQGKDVEELDRRTNASIFLISEGL
jgi:hypothetical protein